VIVNQDVYDDLKIACYATGKDEHELATLAIREFVARLNK